MSDDDFFEDDEPLDRIRARQAEPYDFVAAPPPSAPRALTLSLWQPTGGRYVATDGPTAADEAACR